MTEPLIRPFKFPYEPIHVSLEEGDKFVFASKRASRQTLPADYANNKLRFWNQKNALTTGTPWCELSPAIFYDTFGLSVGFFAINTGTSVSLLTKYYGYPRTRHAGHHSNFTWSHDKANHKFSFECVDEQTEVLTENGFKFFKDLTEEDKVATLNPETEELEFHKPYYRIAYPYKGKMYHFKGRNIDLMVTPNHVMYVQREWGRKREKRFEMMTAETASHYHGLTFKKTARWSGQEQKIFRLPIPEQKKNWRFRVVEEIPMDLWVQFLGWYLAEGNLSHQTSYGNNPSYRITVCQSRKEHYRREIANIIERIGFHPIWDKQGIHVNSKQLWYYLKQFGKGKDKFMPDYIKSLCNQQIEIFLNSYLKGDGHFRGGRWKACSTVSPKLADDIIELSLKVGWAPALNYVNGQYRIHWSWAHKEPKVPKPEIVDYEGMVYCVTVKNHLIYVRRNGKMAWVGNCYFDNDLEETNPTVIIDDGGVAFWTLVAGTESDDTAEKKKGNNSYKVDLSTQTLDAYHDYAADQDWSTKEFLCLYVYGANQGVTIRVECWNEVYASKANGYYYAITDNFTGWKRFVIPIKKFTNIGTPTGWNHIRCIRLLGSASVTATYRFDRVLVDTGQWIKVEVSVPDILASSGDKWKLFAYNQGGAAWRSNPFLTDSAFAQTELQFLDGTLQSEILESGLGGATYAQGERGQNKAPTGDSNAGNIIYSSFYGILKRIGFAVKMSPEDGQDSSTAGISQCKLKLEVYYGKVFSPPLNKDLYGVATYVFSNDNNQYYGLLNINQPWLVLFDETTKTVEFLILSKRPTGLEVRADEDELVDQITLTLPKGTVVYAGMVSHGDLSRDTDGDGVPDFLEDFVEKIVSMRDYAAW